MGGSGASLVNLEGGIPYLTVGFSFNYLFLVGAVLSIAYAGYLCLNLLLIKNYIFYLVG